MGLTYSRSFPKRVIRTMMLWTNALLPFLYPMRHLVKNLNYVRGIFLYFRDYVLFGARNRDARFPLRLLDTFPCMFDRFDSAGAMPRHYFHQDWWAAKKVFESGVKSHLDLGSRIDGFVAHCAVFCKVTVVDIRPMPSPNPNIEFVQGDFTDLKNIPNVSVSSLSSLHVFEHLGLGRYGDPVDSSLLDKAVSEAKRILAPGGSFYFGVPVGIQRLEFNGQRVFAVKTVLEMFSDLELVEFSGINDQDRLAINARVSDFDNAQYSCGLFHFRKK